MHLIIQQDKVKVFIKTWSYENQLRKEIKLTYFRVSIYAPEIPLKQTKIFLKNLNGLLLQFSNYFGDLDFFFQGLHG